MNDNIYKLLNNTRNEEDFTENPLSDKEVNNLMKRFHAENKSDKVQKTTHKNRRIVAAVISVAAVAVLIPTSVYAYNKISASIQKTAPYQNTVKIEPLTDESTPDAAPLSDGYMTWNLGYLPDGYKYDEDGFKIHNSADGSGITPGFYRIPDDMDNFEVDMSNSASCENYESNGNTAMINYRIGYDENDNDPRVFGREVWIYFGDTRYVLQLFIGNGVSQDDLYKIIDNVSLVPSDEKTYSEYFYWLEEPEPINEDYVKSVTGSVSVDECNVVQIGQTGSYKTPDGYLNCSFTINSAEITDSFEGITTNGSGHPTDYSEYMDENGNVLPNTRTWYKVGDGINTIDEEIGSYEMPFHILKLNVTATNNADEYQEICICPNFVRFNQNSVPTPFEIDNNIPQGYEDLKYQTDGFSKVDIYFNDSLFDWKNKQTYLERNEFFSFNTDDAHMGGKNYVNLEAGESADFEVCFMISDNMIGKSYLKFFTIGNSDSQSLKNGYPLYDLTGIK